MLTCAASLYMLWSSYKMCKALGACQPQQQSCQVTERLVSLQDHISRGVVARQTHAPRDQLVSQHNELTARIKHTKFFAYLNPY